MQGREQPKCPECGRTPLFGAQFCPYCGRRLEGPRGPARRVVATPDRNALTDPCAIIFCGEGKLDVARAGRLVADALKRPLPDVTREMRVSRGILAHAIDAEAARRLAEQLEEAGSRVLVIPDAELRQMPPMMRMKNATFGPDGLRCEAYRWDATENMNLPWGRILFVSCARLVLREVVEAKEEEPSEEKQGKKKERFFKRLPSGEKLPKLETRTWHEYVMDVFCDAPWVRLRLDENPAAYALVELASLTGGKLGFYRAARDIVRFAPDLPVNQGVMLLAHNSPEELWDEITFEDKRDFDMYNTWLLQLVRYGYPIPLEGWT